MKKFLALAAALLLFMQAPLARAEIEMDIPIYYQFDYTNTLFRYGSEDKSVKTSGCGAVCASMVISYLSPDSPQTPETLLIWANDHGFYSGNGLSFNAISTLLQEHGVNGQWQTLGVTSLRETLEAGKPIICYMGKGYFSSGGHYIVLRGITDDGMIYVSDPNNATRTQTNYHYSVILDQVLHSDGFCVCTPLDGNP